MDPKTKHHIRGTFYEVLPYYASAYRGEFLGLTAFHLVALAIDDLYGIAAVLTTFTVTMMMIEHL